LSHSSIFVGTTKSNQTPSKSCEKLRELGYIAGKRMALYGEHFEIASDPFIDGKWVAVRVTTESDPTIQTIRLPVSILVGLADLLPQPES
jgi:hypothetical protein